MSEVTQYLVATAQLVDQANRARDRQVRTMLGLSAQLDRYDPERPNPTATVEDKAAAFESAVLLSLHAQMEALSELTNLSRAVVAQNNAALSMVMPPVDVDFNAKLSRGEGVDTPEAAEQPQTTPVVSEPSDGEAAEPAAEQAYAEAAQADLGTD